MRKALESGVRRFVSAVNYTEVLIGPLRGAGSAGAQTVDAMLSRFGIERVRVDVELARRAAGVRAQTNLKLPDAYAVATAKQVEDRGFEDVTLESFDERVVKAYA